MSLTGMEMRIYPLYICGHVITSSPDRDGFPILEIIHNLDVNVCAFQRLINREASYFIKQNWKYFSLNSEPFYNNVNGSELRSVNVTLDFLI